LNSIFKYVRAFYFLFEFKADDYDSFEEAKIMHCGIYFTRIFTNIALETNKSDSNFDNHSPTSEK
jgi:hypothetical protein